MLGRPACAREAEVEAYAGDPLGIALVRFSVDETSGVSVSDARLNLAGDHSRIQFPVFFADPVPSSTSGTVGTPKGFDLLFLFRDTEPFPLVASTNLDRREQADGQEHT